MAEQAARQAMEMAKIDAAEIDMIVVGTCTPDKMFPSTGCLLQDRLGIRQIPAFDVTAACAGFIYGVSIVDQFIRSGAIRCGLVVGSESMSRIIDWKDRRTCILFGDGAGAVVMSQSDTPGVHSTHLHAEGCHKDLLYLDNQFAAPERNLDKLYVHMSGRDVFKLAVTALGDVVDEVLEANKITKEDIDWLVPHQANYRIIKATAKKLDMPMEKVILTVNYLLRFFSSLETVVFTNTD